MTPKEFEARYGINQKTLRNYLRKRWPNHLHNDPWVMTDEMIADAREHFGVPNGTCLGNTTPTPET